MGANGLEFTGNAVRAIAAHVAAFNVQNAKKQAADAEVRRLAETKVAGMGTGGRGRGGRGYPVGRIPWRRSSRRGARCTKARSRR